MQNTSIAIVGAGPSVCAAAIQCARLGIMPLLVDRTGKAGGLVTNAFSVENYPGLAKSIAGPLLAKRFRKNVKDFGIGTVLADIHHIEPMKRSFVLHAEKELFKAQAVILAVGTVPLQIGLPLESKVHQTTIFCEVRDLLKEIPKPKKVAIVGGGEAACDYALTLADTGADVLLVVRGHELKANQRLMSWVHKSKSIRVLLRHCCTAIKHGNRLHITLQPTDANTQKAANPKNISADALLVATGRKSAAPPLLSKFCRATSLQRLSIPGLYVVGDAKRDKLGQVGMAVGDGLEAAVQAVAYLEI